MINFKFCHQDLRSKVNREKKHLFNFNCMSNHVIHQYRDPSRLRKVTFIFSNNNKREKIKLKEGCHHLLEM